MSSALAEYETVVALSVGVFGVIVGVRYGAARSWKEVAEARGARIDEFTADMKELSAKNAELSAQVATLEAQPNLERHALALERIASVLDGIEKRHDQHEERAQERHQAMLDALARWASPRNPDSRTRTTDDHAA